MGECVGWVVAWDGLESGWGRCEWLFVDGGCPCNYVILLRTSRVYSGVYLSRWRYIVLFIGAEAQHQSTVREYRSNSTTQPNYPAQSRSPRWSSGNPRKLLHVVVLVREFESRRGEISNILQK